MRIGPRIEVHIEPNKTSSMFLLVNDEVVWERYGMDYNKMITALIIVSDLIQAIDSQFTLVIRRQEE